MRIVLISIITALCLEGTAIPGVVRLDLKADIHGDTVIDVFRGQLLIPRGDSRDVFAGPFTLALTPKESSKRKYKLEVDLAGLGPDFKKFSYNFDLSIGEKTLIPGLPVKNATTITYSITVLDDTSSFRSYVEDSVIPAEWDTSTTIHYLTRQVRGSLADFTWNNKMGYLENIYDQFRHSYKLSMFNKIDMSFYPEPTDTVYMDSRRHYAILPNSNKINLVYGHDFDAAFPAPAAELLIYKLWGYGPRWMVAGMAHYYDGNDLILRKFAGKLDYEDIRKNILFDAWVDSDTGTVFCGGFVNWLLTTYSFPDFLKLYKDSSPFGYESNFKKIYGKAFGAVLKDFIEYMARYKPESDELEYFASIYLRHNDFARAADLYREMSSASGNKKEENLVNLAACEFWSGDYRTSANIYDTLLTLYGKNPRYMMLKADALLALGDFVPAIKLYEDSFQEFDQGNSGLRLVTILIDEGKIDSARTIFRKLKGEVLGRLDYSIEEARLRISAGEANADSSLMRAADGAIAGTESAPDDPRAYLVAGKAFALLGRYDRAADNLNIAYFLERKPYYLASTLLELGKTADLQGKRKEAIEYYTKASKSAGGVYIDKLCEKYIKSGYRLRK